MATGVDTPNNTLGQAGCLRGEGVGFVCRYYFSPHYAASWKVLLCVEEAQALSAAGLNVVAAWETAPTQKSYFSQSQGESDGRDAYELAQGIGQPEGTPIYFAVDFDADEATVTGPIRQYFEGVASAFAAAGNGTSAYRVGAYGSGLVCSTLLTADVVTMTWLAQSTGWRGYGDFHQWNIKQGPATKMCGLDVDSDETSSDNYGGFQIRT